MATPEATAVLRGVFRRLDWPDTLLADKYPVWLGQRRTVSADFVGFGSVAPHDLSTAVILGMQVGSDQLLDTATQIARALAVPALVCVGTDEVSLYAPNGRLNLIDQIRIRDLPSVERWRGRLRPRDLLDAKRGFRQQTLFPVDVRALSAARTVSAENLASLIGGTLLLVGDGDLDQGQTAARIVAATLTELVAADKAGQARDVDQLTTRIRARLSHLVLEPLNTAIDERIRMAVSELGNAVDFTGLDSSILSDVYEQTLITRVDRRQRGIYYTPPGLARKLLATLPFETIEPERRVVLDPACGSGSLLVAAHDRMRALQPDYWDESIRHLDLTARIRGTDQDPFAVELARLALTLHALPAGNGWDLRPADALAATEAETGSDVSIVVANPPFQNLPPSGGKREEFAEAFLRRAIRTLTPGGLLGVIMPVTWLTSDASAGGREWLRQQCDVFEIWRMPSGTFVESTAAISVVFAKRQERSRNSMTPLLLQRVTDADRISQFLDLSTPRADQRHLEITDDFGVGPVGHSLKKAELAKLSTVAIVQIGAQPESGHLAEVSAAMRAGRPLGPYPWLPALGKLRQHTRTSQLDLPMTDWPTGFHRVRARSDRVAAPKLLVGTQVHEESPWLRLLLDDAGVVTGNSLHWVIPDPEAMSDSVERSPGQRTIPHSFGPNHYALFALLSSALAAAWIDERASGRNLAVRVLQDLPIPRPGHAWAELADVGAQLARADGHPSVSLLRHIDRVVFSAYDDSDRLSQLVVRRLAGVPDPALNGDSRYPADSAPSGFRSSDPLVIERAGIVLDVQASQLQLQVPGLTPSDGLWCELPELFPGHLCRPGSTFRIWADEGDLPDLFDDDTLRQSASSHSVVTDSIRATLRTARYVQHTYSWSIEDESVNDPFYVMDDSV